jgi:hypothetical protein
MHIYIYARRLAITALLTIVISSCVQPTERFITPSPVITIYPTRSATALPLVTLTQSASATSTSLSTAIPTLPSEEAQAKFLDLLASNSGCRLSCFWGIVPGKTSFQEAQAILAPLGSISDFTAFRDGLGSVSPYLTEGNWKLYTTLDFSSNSETNLVNSISFNAEAHRPLEQGGYEDLYNSNKFGEMISAYTLPRVLSELDEPESVMISTVGGPLTRGGTGGFDLLLLYPDQGILINYTTQMHLTGKDVRGCLTNAHVEMELHPFGQPDLFFGSLQKTDWAVKLSNYKPLEEVAPISAQEFYETFSEPTNKCIETPANLWPTPEP